MRRAPDPWHYWLVALGKTAEWLIAYANQPGDAASGSVEVQVQPAAPPPPSQQEQK